MPYTSPQIQQQHQQHQQHHLHLHNQQHHNQPNRNAPPVPRYAPVQQNYGTGNNSSNTSPTSTYQQASHLPIRSTSSSASSSEGHCDNGPLNAFLAHYMPPRQLHPPKSPLYRPAVLRTTERPSRPSTATGNSSGSGSPSEGKEGGYSGSGSGNGSGVRPSGGAVTAAGVASGLSIFGTGTGDILSNVFGTTTLGTVPEWEEVIEKPCTAPPHRGHWKEDALSTTCDSPVCAKSFSLFERRHHCRRCGHVFCSQHSSHLVRLDQDCEFHPQGYLSRTCDGCFDEYRRLVAQRRASNTSTGTNSSGDSTAPSSPVMGIGIGIGRNGCHGGKADNTFGGKMAGSYVGSVPRDWTWSTF